jgi:hypothetical protein
MSEAFLIWFLILWFVLVLAYSVFEWICFMPGGILGLITSYFYNCASVIVFGVKLLGYTIVATVCAVIVLVLILGFITLFIGPVIAMVLFIVL